MLPVLREASPASGESRLAEDKRSGDWVDLEQATAGIAEGLAVKTKPSRVRDPHAITCILMVTVPRRPVPRSYCQTTATAEKRSAQSCAV